MGLPQHAYGHLQQLCDSEVWSFCRWPTRWLLPGRIMEREPRSGLGRPHCLTVNAGAVATRVSHVEWTELLAPQQMLAPTQPKGARIAWDVA